eukprot:CFRG2758T1
MAETSQLVNLTGMDRQVGTMIISQGGDIISATGELDGPNNQSTFFGILHDTGCLLDGTPLKRVCLTYDTFEFILTMGGESQHIYVVKKTL